MLTALRASFGAGAGAPRRYDPARALCVMHIPKASGTSFIASLGAAIAPKHTVTGFDRVLFGGFSAFDTFSNAERARIFQTPQAVPAGADFVAGHFACSTLRTAYPAAQLVTVLREPFTRLLSLWMFWRTASDEVLAAVGAWGDYVRHARQPLRSFLAEPAIAAQTDNQTLRMLLWPDPRLPDSGFIRPANDAPLLRAARRRLHQFDFAAIVEAPDLSARLQSFLGRPVTTTRLNETANMPPALRTPFAAELDASTLALLAARSRLDLQLWQDLAGKGENIRQQTMLQHVAKYGAMMNIAK